MKEKKPKRSQRILRNKKIKRLNSKAKIKSKIFDKIVTSIKNDSDPEQSCQIKQKSIIFKNPKEQENLVRQSLKKIHNQYLLQKLEKSTNSEIASQYIQNPQITIEQLFSSKKLTFLSSSFKKDEFYQSLKKLNNQLQNKNRNVIISKGHQSFIIESLAGRREQNKHFKGRFISSFEKEVIEKRSNFMEKIIQNQIKYKDLNSQLSQLSKQMLFLLKIYKQNDLQIKQIVNQLRQKQGKQLNNLGQNHTCPMKQYIQILINKNLKNAFNSTKQIIFDQLNYFKIKQFEQNNAIFAYRPILNSTDLEKYFLKKKSRKNKTSNFILPTACSCCFSDYYEQYNPLLNCSVCKLRYHRYCFNHKKDKCGNCSYRKLSKQIKEFVPFCYICKIQDQMTIKLGKNIYCHAFCLLMHNCWKIKEVNIKMNQQENSIIDQQEKQLQYDSMEEKIEELQKQKVEINSQCLENQQRIQKNKNYQIIYRITKSLTFEKLKKQKSSIFSDDRLSSFDEMKITHSQIEENQSQYKCHVCQNDIQKHFYISCNKCHTKYHIFCSFFEGFKLQKNEKGQWILTCCFEKTYNLQQQKRRRGYILNKERYLYQNSSREKVNLSA